MNSLKVVTTSSTGTISFNTGTAINISTTKISSTETNKYAFINSSKTYTLANGTGIILPSTYINSSKTYTLANGTGIILNASKNNSYGTITLSSGNSISGNIVNVSSGAIDLGQTATTLKFASGSTISSEPVTINLTKFINATSETINANSYYIPKDTISTISKTVNIVDDSYIYINMNLHL
ncbi:hypothetical protein N9W34_02535 [Rickettsiales bacterium]|nr:hypothetical protein [Rickettsiales bacterium]